MARLRLLILTALCVLAVPAVAAVAAEEPVAIVERLHTVLTDTMRNADGLGIEGRYRALRPVLDEVYDFRTMIAIVVGSHWSSAGEDARRALLDAFTRLSAATYADMFGAYAGESFQIAGMRPGPRGTTLVDTRIERSDGEPVAITYVMRPAEQGWRIIDVLLDGSISELALRRSDYAAILSDGGVERLTEVLNDKVEDMLDAGPS